MARRGGGSRRPQVSDLQPWLPQAPSPALTAALHAITPCSNLTTGPGASPQGFPRAPPALPAPPRSEAPHAPPPPQQKEPPKTHTHTPLPGMEQSQYPSTLREPAPATSTSPASWGVRPPPGEDGSARLQSAGRNPPASMEGPARHLHTHTRLPPPPPPRTPAMDGSSRPSRGRTMVGEKSRLVPTFARLPPLPGASLRRLPQRRVPARCPGTGSLRPGSAPMWHRRYGNPPRPRPSHRADPPPPPSWARDEAPARGRELLWGKSGKNAKQAGRPQKLLGCAAWAAKALSMDTHSPLSSSGLLSVTPKTSG